MTVTEIKNLSKDIGWQMQPTELFEQLQLFGECTVVKILQSTANGEIAFLYGDIPMVYATNIYYKDMVNQIDLLGLGRKVKATILAWIPIELSCRTIVRYFKTEKLIAITSRELVFSISVASSLDKRWYDVEIPEPKFIFG